MKHGLAAFSMLAILAGGAAMAQSQTPAPRGVVVPVAPVAPPEEDAPVPELPAVPEDLNARVAALREVAENTTTCWTARGERFEHTASRQCPGWYARLARGGAATAFAVGQMLNRTSTDSNTREDYDADLSYTGERLVRMLAATRAPEAVPFMLAYLGRTMREMRPDSYAGVVERAMYESLADLTGYDVAPIEPWESGPSLTTRRMVIQAWLRWYGAHQGETRAQWQAQGTGRAREALASGDPGVRFAGVRRLLARPADRVRARAALTELLGREDLPAEARAHLVRYARRHGVPVPASRDNRRAALAPAAAL